MTGGGRSSPRPRLHLIRFHGVLARQARNPFAWRSSAPVHADTPFPGRPTGAVRPPPRPPYRWRRSYGLIVIRLSTFVTPGADQAARSAS